MKIILVLLKKELIKMKKNILIFLSIGMLFPLLMYLFISIPLSLVFINMKPIYLNWSFPGIIFVSILMLVYFCSIIFFKNNYKSNYIKTLPVSNVNTLVSNYLFCFIVGMFQLIFSIIVLSSILKENIPFTTILTLIILILPSIVLMSNIAIFFSITIRRDLIAFFINILIFISLAFGLGSFFPITYFPENYIQVIKYFPFSGTIINMQKIMIADSIYFSLFFVSIIYSILSTVGAFRLIIHKKQK